MIRMWSGMVDDVPRGWLICDGRHGTCDLSDKFIRNVFENGFDDEKEPASYALCYIMKMPLEGTITQYIVIFRI